MTKYIKSILLASFILVTTSTIAQNNSDDGNGVMINLQEPEYAEMSFQDILDKYKGKVVYIDFWASWCGPCKKQMPYSAKIKKQLDGKDVVFLYISSDRNENAWRNAVAAMNIKGENYRTSAKVWNEYNDLFDVKYIPRYVLIDKNGQVINDNAKRPSDPAIITDIESLL